MTLLISSTTGLNTVETPFDISYDQENGISDLAYAVNIQITPSGKIERTDGYASIASGSFHSAFCDGGDCFVGKTTYLYALERDKTTLTGVRSGLSGNRISFAQVGEKTFYTNYTESGMIVDKVSYPWVTNEVEADMWPTVLLQVPHSEHLSSAFGRIFFSIENVLYWTEYMLHGLYSPARNNVTFGSRIRMHKPVEGGLFVSDDTATYFLAGRDPHSFQIAKVSEYPAYEWSEAIGYVEGAEVGASSGPCALWSSPEGACLGTAQGQLINLNKSKVIYPETGRYGAGLLRGYQFINSIF